MGWSDYPLNSITIPGTAGPDDVRVFIGQDDPLITAIGADNGIVWYYRDGAGFVTWIQRNDPGTFGRWALSHLDLSNNPSSFRDYIRAEYNWTDESAYLQLGDPNYGSYTALIGESVTINSGLTGLLIVPVNGGSVLMTLNPAAPTTDFKINNVSAPRGYYGCTNTGFANVNFTPAGTQVTGGTAAVTSGTLDANRRYRVTFEGTYTSTVAGDVVGTRIYEGSIAGTLRRDLGELPAVRVAGNTMPFQSSVIVTGAPATVAFALGVRKVAGAGTCTVLVNHTLIEDVTGP